MFNLLPNAVPNAVGLGAVQPLKLETERTHHFTYSLSLLHDVTVVVSLLASIHFHNII